MVLMTVARDVTVMMARRVMPPVRPIAVAVVIAVVVVVCARDGVDDAARVHVARGHRDANAPKSDARITSRRNRVLMFTTAMKRTTAMSSRAYHASTRYAARTPAAMRRGRGRGGVVDVRAKKKGFAEFLNVSIDRERARASWYNDREPLKPGVVSPMRAVPAGILRPPYADSGHLPEYDDRKVQVQTTAEDIEGMRAAGALAARVLDMAEQMCAPGVSTEDIDKAVHEMTVEAGAYPSPLNYGGFPKSVCTSLNECICHGIPTVETVLQEGDIINVDVTVYLNGYHGDTSRTIMIGTVTDEVRHLVETTEKALQAAIDVCKPGTAVRKIGATIHGIADAANLGVVDKFVGHGVGKEFHSGPTVRHHRNNDPGTLRVGQTFTIEPMLTIGTTRDKMWKDGWTSCTADGKWTAQCEHTLLITEDGVDILTASPYRASLSANN